uniref:SH3 domain-containing protein n=1 Tax=Arcella intermedia TaxID=1963864 RepID=A0A6B2L7S2_9EUKA
MNLKEGDIVTIHVVYDDEWIKGELNGVLGVFPENYVQILESSTPTVMEAVAQYPFKATVQGQISFEVGDVIEVLDKLQKGWWSGKLLSTGKVGLFPGSYVKEKNPSAATTSTPSSATTSATVSGTNTGTPSAKLSSPTKKTKLMKALKEEFESFKTENQREMQKLKDQNECLKNEMEVLKNNNQKEIQSVRFQNQKEIQNFQNEIKILKKENHQILQKLLNQKSQTEQTHEHDGLMKRQSLSISETINFMSDLNVKPTPLSFGEILQSIGNEYPSLCIQKMLSDVEKWYKGWKYEPNPYQLNEDEAKSICLYTHDLLDEQSDNFNFLLNEILRKRSSKDLIHST